MSYSGTTRSRTTVVRVPDRGHYDRATIDAIVDEGFVCHVGRDSRRARLISDVAEKTEALRRFTHLVGTRWEEVRQPTSLELEATTVLAISLAESSAKIPSGPPNDDEADNAWRVWAGVVPLVDALAPVPADHVSPFTCGF